MADHVFRGNAETRVLWKWQVTCSVEMAYRMFRGNGKSHVPWKWQITCSVEMANHMFRGNYKSHVPRKWHYAFFCMFIRQSFLRQCFGKYLDIFTCLCFMYVSTLSVVQTRRHPTSEHKSYRRELSRPALRYHPEICLEVQRNTTTFSKVGGARGPEW